MSNTPTTTAHTDNQKITTSNLLSASSEDDDDEGDVDEGDVDGNEEEEEEEESIEDELSRIVIPPSLPKRGNVNIPKLIECNKKTFDCPYLVSCHVLSSILSSTPIIGLTSPEELREMSIKIVSDKDYKNEYYPEVNKDSLNKHIDTILQVDPYMYCWTNFHISYLFSHWVVIGKNAVNNLDPSQKKLRLKAWYYVIIFLCRKMQHHTKALDSVYLLSVIQCILKIAEVKNFDELMKKQKLNEPAGIDTEHWDHLQVCITSYSQDDSDNSDWETILTFLIDKGKIKKRSLKTITTQVKKEVRKTVTSKPEKLPPADTLLQVTLVNNMHYMYSQLQQMVLDKMDYQNRLLRKEREMKTLAERIVAVQENISKLLSDQIIFSDMKDQQGFLDTHHALIADRSDVKGVITCVEYEMRPFKAGKVFAEDPPEPGHFPTIGELAKKLPSSETKELPTVGVKRKLSDPGETPASPSPVDIMDLKQVMECFEEYYEGEDQKEEVIITGSKQPISERSKRMSKRETSAITPTSSNPSKKRRVNKQKKSKDIAHDPANVPVPPAPSGTSNDNLPEVRKTPTTAPAPSADGKPLIEKLSEVNLPEGKLPASELPEGESSDDKLSVEPSGKHPDEPSGKLPDEPSGKLPDEPSGKLPDASPNGKLSVGSDEKVSDDNKKVSKEVSSDAEKVSASTNEVSKEVPSDDKKVSASTSEVPKEVSGDDKKVSASTGEVPKEVSGDADKVPEGTSEVPVVNTGSTSVTVPEINSSPLETKEVLPPSAQNSALLVFINMCNNLNQDFSQPINSFLKSAHSSILWDTPVAVEAYTAWSARQNKNK